MSHPALRPIALATLAAFSSPLWAETTSLDQVVITAPRMDEPLTVVTDPQAPQQPVPANDGASYLKNIPGFTVIRKAGTDGDPVLRGLTGSRLNILVDGADFHGGCGMRMDPPTAYVFPETFDRVTVIKGPQTVLHGNGNSAGVVLFERDPKMLSRPGTRFDASLMAGSWGRLDGLVSGGAASDKGYVQATATHAESNDYKDGDGKSVRSFYERESLSALAGWTPDANTRLEFSAVASQAEAAYADRGMDGVKFDRQGYGLKFEKSNLGPVLQRIKAQLDYNYIDHVMDNYSLRPLSGMAMVNNPDRETLGSRVSADLLLGDATLLSLGTDWQGNEHTVRQAQGPAAYGVEARPRMLDMETDIRGLFAELRHEMSPNHRLIGGLRVDDWSAERYNSANGAYIAGAGETLSSGFARFERDLTGSPATVFVGLGHSERPMDYWEASTYGGLTAASQLRPEKNTQLDAGLIWKTDTVRGSISAFYSKVEDYILTWSKGSCSTPGNCAVSNVDATRYGGEADLAWRFAPAWTLRGTLAYVHASNDTRNVPLAQTPPLEGRLGLDWTGGAWTLGGVLRLVAEQDRVDTQYGNIVGQDYGRTAGFATLALNGAYKPNKQLLISAGIDNVFDRTYSEHLARDNSFEAGASTRVNEPGRFAWAKLNYKFD